MATHFLTWGRPCVLFITRIIVHGSLDFRTDRILGRSESASLAWRPLPGAQVAAELTVFSPGRISAPTGWHGQRISPAGSTGNRALRTLYTGPIRYRCGVAQRPQHGRMLNDL